MCLQSAERSSGGLLLPACTRPLPEVTSAVTPSGGYGWQGGGQLVTLARKTAAAHATAKIQDQAWCFCPLLSCLQVELILVELEEGGSCSTKFSAGWTQVGARRLESLAGHVQAQHDHQDEACCLMGGGRWVLKRVAKITAACCGCVCLLGAAAPVCGQGQGPVEQAAGGWADTGISTSDEWHAKIPAAEVIDNA
jgi:hypothetical protein